MIAFAALLALSRGLLAPKYLYYFDSVNFALALDKFNPALHRPQPPGYALFVALCRVLHWFVARPERVFLVAGLLASLVALLLLWRLGAEMFSSRVGLIAALLLLFNPPFWFGGITNQVRIFLAAGALAVMLAAWRAWQPGSPAKRFYLAAGLLGIAGGFRPELMLLEAPLVILTGLHGRRSLRQWGIAALALAAAAAPWLGYTLYVVGGASNYVRMSWDYVHQQFQPAPRSAWWMLRATIVWNGLGVLTWLWAAKYGDRRRVPLSVFAFLAAAFIPVFLFNALVHVGDPDQVLAGIPVLCLLGGIVLSGRRTLPVAAAVLLNVVVFFRPFPGLPRATSYKAVRDVDRVTRATYGAIRDLGRSGPLFLVCYDSSVTWRNLSYYFPDDPLLVLNGDPRKPPDPRASWLMWQRQRRDPPVANGEFLLPSRGQVVWLLSPAREVRALLSRQQSLKEKAPVYYVEARPGMEFQFGEFRFATPAGGALPGSSPGPPPN